MELQKFSAIIVAGGSGSRLGNTLPKAFVPLNNKPLFTYSLKVFDNHPLCEEIILVIPKEQTRLTHNIISELTLLTKITVVAGGALRFESALNGIKAATSTSLWVLIHDAARPFVSHAVIDSLLNMQNRYECAISATPMVDTVRTISGDHATGTIDRNTLVRVGTPQMFKKELLLNAFEHCDFCDQSITDEAMLMERAGHCIGIALGDPQNFKITTPADLTIAQALCATFIV